MGDEGNMPGVARLRPAFNPRDQLVERARAGLRGKRLRLAARGLVVRQDDPADGRSVLVVITDEGIERVDEAITRLIAEEEALLAGVDPDEADALARGLRALSLRMGAIDD